MTPSMREMDQQRSRGLNVCVCVDLRTKMGGLFMGTTVVSRKHWAKPFNYIVYPSQPILRMSLVLNHI